MISFAKRRPDDNAQKKSLRDLLTSSFDWSCADFDEVFNSFDSDHAFLLEDNRNRVISCLFVYDVVDDDGDMWAFLFSLATLPDYRRRGLMTSLYQDFAEPCLKRSYRGACLVPANEDLIPYYERLGFRVVSTQGQEPFCQMANDYRGGSIHLDVLREDQSTGLGGE